MVLPRPPTERRRCLLLETFQTEGHDIGFYKSIRIAFAFIGGVLGQVLMGIDLHVGWRDDICTRVLYSRWTSSSCDIVHYISK